MSNVNNALSELRALFEAPPSHAVWRSICEALDTCPDDALRVALDYAQEHLDGWPDELRTMPVPWLEGLSHGTMPDGRWIAYLSQHTPPALRVLALREAELRLTPQHAMALVGSERLARFERLDLRGNPIVAEAAQLLSERALFGVQM